LVKGLFSTVPAQKAKKDALLLRVVDDRRRSGRFEPPMQIPARVGRRAGVVLNVSHRGVRVRHPGSLKPSEMIDLAFPCGGGQFVSRARVLSCRAMPLKDADGQMVF
jgi:PilZ domain